MPQPIAPSASSSSAANRPPPQLQALPPDAFAQSYPLFKDLLADLIRETGGAYSLNGIFENIRSGKWIFWVVWSGEVEACFVTELSVGMTGVKTCSIPWCTGAGAKRWVPLLSEVEQWARREGCSRFELVTRKGWAKHLQDFKMTHVVLEKEI